MRNRIISGVSLLTVVVEAGTGSGAIITAQAAAEQGRDVMAVPGNINSPYSLGANKLIADGAAGSDGAGGYIEGCRHRTSNGSGRNGKNGRR